MFGWVSEGDLKVYLQPELAFCICSNRYITERVTMPSSVSPTPHTEAFSTYSCTPHLVATNTNGAGDSGEISLQGQAVLGSSPWSFFSASVLLTHTLVPGGCRGLCFLGCCWGGFGVFFGVFGCCVFGQQWVCAYDRGSLSIQCSCKAFNIQCSFKSCCCCFSPNIPKLCHSALPFTSLL